MIGKIKNILRKSIFYKVYKDLSSKIAASTFWHPSKQLILIGVTWTDGKSTTSNMIHKILNENLGKTALFTTVNQKFWNIELPNNYKMTNVSAWKTQEFLKQAVEEGCKYCVLEVSSHWIDQKRVANIYFDAAVLTNITPEHLDYHKNLIEYANTKKKLFQWVIENKNWLGIGILNKDDEFWKEWLEELPLKVALSYWIYSTAQFKAENIKESLDWTYFELKYLNQNYPVNLKLPGLFNVYNALAAISLAFALKVPIEKSIKSLEELEPIKGRVNKIYDKNKKATFIVDYAHTPNALKSVLELLKKVKNNWRLIVVFGAPGMRDQYKRPKMWEIVDKYADIIILTDDDPDKEDRFKIIEQVKKGIKRDIWDNFWILPERKEAVHLAYDIAKEWDIILIAWKWHEEVQLTNHWKIKYSDLQTIKNLVNGN